MMFGIGKLTEETGELSEAMGAYPVIQLTGRIQQLLGKAIAFPVGNHPDGEGPIKRRLMDEIADTRAALSYFSLKNFNEEEIAYMEKRGQDKLNKFAKWGLTGVAYPTIEPKKG